MNNITPEQLSEEKKNKRIVSNTILLFLRMLLITIINLYTVRLIFKGLGKEDYGIFNTIAGVVTLSSFICSVLALALQRFYSIALGKKSEQAMREIFSTGIKIVLHFSIAVIFLFETIGLWFVYTQLTIPIERMSSTLWVYHFSLISLILSFIQIPYTAAIFSHEDMNKYTIISSIDCMLRFIAAFLISHVNIDHFVFYGITLMTVSFIIFLFYAFIARKSYPECHFQQVNNTKLYQQILSFGGWTTFGSLANTSMVQGNTILINIFFGPIVNVAFGVAVQINNAFNALCNSMILPFRPAMIKAYAEENYIYLNRLFTVSNKFIFYTLMAIAIPLISEMDFILNLWLGSADKNMIRFSQLMIIYVVLIAMHNPITIIMHASGHIKEYHLPVEVFTIICLPITWILYKLHLPSYSVFISMLFFSFCAHGVRLACLKHFYCQFSISQYLQSILAPGIFITLVASGVAYELHTQLESFIAFIAEFICIPICVFVFVYHMGLSLNEKKVLKTFVRKIIKHKK